VLVQSAVWVHDRFEMFEERGLVCSSGVQFPVDTQFNDVLHYHPHEIVCPDDACVHLLEEIAIAVQEARQKHDLLILGTNHGAAFTDSLELDVIKDSGPLHRNESRGGRYQKASCARSRAGIKGPSSVTASCTSNRMGSGLGSIGTVRAWAFSR
jgi:hypothetical protein